MLALSDAAHHRRPSQPLRGGGLQDSSRGGLRRATLPDLAWWNTTVVGLGSVPGEARRVDALGRSLGPVAFPGQFGYLDRVEATRRHWLELTSGRSVPISGTCSIGRAHSNQLVLSDEKVSRHHALIQAIDNDECWIIDLASVNGTYVNHRRIEQSTLLHDRDEITVGPDRILFRSSAAGSGHRDQMKHLDQTVHEVRQLTAWLFLVDVIDSTSIGRRLGADAMATTFSGWFTLCRETLEGTGGIIDKPLGDGFFAFWPAAERTAAQICGALLTFRQIQCASVLPFRMVLHRGVVFTGGQMSSGIYRLFGADVSFTFRMEALAKSLKIDCLVSEPAMEGLSGHTTTVPVGAHQLAGVQDPLPFFRL